MMGGAEWQDVAAAIGVGGSVLANLALAARALWRWLRKAEGREERIHEQGWTEVQRRDHQIELLRRMLDRCRRRESAYATSLELACLAMRLSPAEQAETVARIRTILSSVLPASGAERS